MIKALEEMINAAEVSGNKKLEKHLRKIAKHDDATQQLMLDMIQAMLKKQS